MVLKKTPHALTEGPPHHLYTYSKCIYGGGGVFFSQFMGNGCSLSKRMGGGGVLSKFMGDGELPQ